MEEHLEHHSVRKIVLARHDFFTHVFVSGHAHTPRAYIHTFIEHPQEIARVQGVDRGMAEGGCTPYMNAVELASVCARLAFQFCALKSNDMCLPENRIFFY